VPPSTSGRNVMVGSCELDLCISIKLLFLRRAIGLS